MMPSFLFEYPGIGIDQGIENGIEVYMHEVEIILVVHTGDRICSKIFRCKCIHESVQRTFLENVERTFYGEVFAAVKNRMFQYVRSPAVIIGESLEGNREGFIGIIAGELHYFRSAFYMFQKEHIGIQLFNKSFFDQFVAGVT